MPKAIRNATSQGQYTTSQAMIVNDPSRPRYVENQYFPEMMSSLSSTTSTNQLPPYLVGGPVQQFSTHSRTTSQDTFQRLPQLPQTYLTSANLQTLPTRASSGAWTPEDDKVLLHARATGSNWAPIQRQFFPRKTPNACRKRHERLMDRRNSDDWGEQKIEIMAKEYMNMRKEMWSLLSEKTGERWGVLEAKCLGAGLKSLSTLSRKRGRREKMNSDGFGGRGYRLSDSFAGTDDSGLGPDSQEAQDGSAYDASESLEVTALPPPQYQFYTGHGLPSISQSLTPELEAGKRYEEGQQEYARWDTLDTGIGQRILHEPVHSGYVEQGRRLGSIESMGIESIIHQV